MTESGFDSSRLTNNRLERLFDYPFTRLAGLLQDITPPPGLAPIAMSLGEPQHIPPALIDQTLRANAHLWGKYPPVNGAPAFRAAVAAWLGRRYGLPPGALDPERSVLPVAGTREALFQVALLTVPESKSGRQPAVLMPNPFYAVYEGAATLAGAEPVFLSATRDSGFLPDLSALSEDLLARTALMYLCSPGNPQGAAADGAYFTRALTLARQFGFVLAVDECYSEIYTGPPPSGALEAALALGGPDPWANLLVFHSLSKRSSAAGLRSGFVAGDPHLMTRFARLRSYANAGTPLPVLAAATALWQDEAHVADNRARYAEKFAAAEAILAPAGAGTNRLRFSRPAGGFFLWLEVGDGEQATRRLWAEGAVRVLPGGYLARTDAQGFNPGAAFIRVALVDDTHTVAEGCRRMAAIL